MSGTDFISKVCAIEGNNFCADCGSRAPRWASVNLGVLLCINCSGIHRTLGVHLSQVKSLTLDNLKPEWIKSLLSIGNHVANTYYLYKLPRETSKYHMSTAPSDMEAWIRNKYEKKLYAMDGVDEPFLLLSKGFNPRDAIINRTVNMTQEQPQQQKTQSKQEKMSPQPDLLDLEQTKHSKMQQTTLTTVDDFNPFSIDTTKKVEETKWKNEEKTTVAIKEEKKEKLEIKDEPEPEDSEKSIQAKIDAAKHSIAKLFQNPTQIGFKESSYKQTNPKSISGETLNFEKSNLKEKLEGINSNLL